VQRLLRANYGIRWMRGRQLRAPGRSTSLWPRRYPGGGPRGFLMLCERDEWLLPFKVRGYYDLRGHDLVHKAGGLLVEPDLSF
jgi:hypothetical protein